MRVVLDTNIFISGIFWPGNFCSRIIEFWKNNKVELVSSLEIVNEIVATLQEFKIKLTPEKITEWEKEILERSLIVTSIKKLNIIKDDPDDNKFLEAALAGKAQYIISQDNHLLNIKEFQGINIVKPEDFLKLMK